MNARSADKFRNLETRIFCSFNWDATQMPLEDEKKKKRSNQFQVNLLDCVIPKRKRYGRCKVCTNPEVDINAKWFCGIFFSPFSIGESIGFTTYSHSLTYYHLRTLYYVFIVIMCIKHNTCRWKMFDWCQHSFLFLFFVAHRDEWNACKTTQSVFNLFSNEHTWNIFVRHSNHTHTHTRAHTLIRSKKKRSMNWWKSRRRTLFVHSVELTKMWEVAVVRGGARWCAIHTFFVLSRRR